jgi:hypothetical protein
VLWFDVLAVKTYKGEPSNERVMQSHDRVAARYNGRSASVEIATVETVPMDDPDALAYDAAQANRQVPLDSSTGKEALHVDEDGA